MLSETELHETQVVASRLLEPVTLEVFSPGLGDAFERALTNTAAQVSGVSANRILYEVAQKGPFPDKPSVTICWGENGRIHYSALPEGAEFKPFLEAIAWLGRDPEAKPPDPRARLSGVPDELEIHILALMASACPHCPVVVRSCLEIAVLNHGIRLVVADAVQFPDLAEKYKVKSTPTLVINGGATFVGAIGVEELAGNISRAVDPNYLTDTIKSMINTGRAEDAADFLMKSNNPRAAIPLLESAEFSTRIGVLVALEEALEIDSQSLDPMVDDLILLLESDDTGLRGDTAELLGNIGVKKSGPYLERLKDDPDEDVRDAAMEALDKLNR